MTTCSTLYNIYYLVSFKNICVFFKAHLHKLHTNTLQFLSFLSLSWFCHTFLFLNTRRASHSSVSKTFFKLLSHIVMFPPNFQARNDTSNQVAWEQKVFNVLMERRSSTFKKPHITCKVTPPCRYLSAGGLFLPPFSPPHSLAASGDGVSLASSLTKDKWARGLWWSTMAARGFQNSKLFFITGQVMWSRMQESG